MGLPEKYKRWHSKGKGKEKLTAEKKLVRKHLLKFKKRREFKKLYEK